MFNIIALAICILIITFLYDRYIQKYKPETELDLYHKLQDYLLNKSTVAKKSIGSNKNDATTNEKNLI